ncbi:hypothetical protein [Halobellus sp. GM3]|uniref:hypothetical protein n=1 Tax=Halobellus sp. GM3 TaxID=3458410 RepID=UPI00403DD9DC
MPTITVTEAQVAALNDIQAGLEAAYIDTYGHVRPQDAVQYLLDTYTPPEQRNQTNTKAYEIIADAESPQLQRVAATVEEVPGSGIESATMRGMLLATLGVEEFAARLHEHSEVDDETAGSTEAESEGKSTSASSTEPSSNESSSGSDSILSAANQMLDAHSENWREASGGEEPYEVDLPDGTTVGVRTKDDVRQLLFKHY